MFLILFALVACDSVSCSAYPVGTCSDAQVCCSSTDCLYQSDGQDFVCAGTDCAAAAEEFTAFCSSYDTAI